MDILEQEMANLKDLNLRSAQNFNVYAGEFSQQSQVKLNSLYDSLD